MSFQWGPAMREISSNYEAVADDVISAIKERGRDVFLPTDPLRQRFALDGLIRLQQRYELGDKRSLPLAISLCATHHLALPDWAANAFNSACDRMTQYEVDSWDKALGCTNPKGKHLEKAKKRQKDKHNVFYRVVEIIYVEEPDTAIDDALFDRVSTELGVGKRRCKEYWSELSKIHMPCRKKHFFECLNTDPIKAALVFVLTTPIRT
jgi:hypothetical protein